MDSAVTGLLAAAIGVGGTLGSAWLTQRRGDAARREEWERLERTRTAELAAQRRQSDVTDRRAAYTVFNTAARHYLAALNDHAHVLLHPGAEDQDAALAAVDTARAEYRRRYAEAQMIVPDAVLAEVREVNTALGAIYGTLARLTRGVPRDGDELPAAQAGIRRGWQLLSRMRAAMRADLDVTGPSHGRDAPRPRSSP
ncbi:hypothetical protein [Streptomyces sp. NBC_01198]|uniref:hypothetical protein n=1 Tax=Streptomyces sp. NBC_01198 TaxID=2903769 RepID=UPI002E0D19F5|nr:hypothetical protein OG702_19800 [Streptomyces sp. NBC_01198]